MKKIFRHIEYLLLTHDHVIIPQLGGFVASYMPSTWNAAEDTFCPPCRTVHFNASLNSGDSLLVDSLAERFSISTAEAERWCAHFVQMIRQNLLECGSIDFGSIGLMIQETPEQPITFSPCRAGVSTPALFGLDAFAMPLLSASQKPKQKRQMAQAKKTHYTIRFNRRAMHHMGIAAVTIVLFFLCALPIGIPNSTATQARMALFELSSLLSIDSSTDEEQVIEDVEETMPEEMEEEMEMEEAIDAQEEAQEIEEATVEAQETTVEESQPAMAIVLASSVPLKNAERYAAALQSQGIDAHVYQRGKMVRVVVPCYEGEDQARQTLRQMQQSSSDFQQAWITALQ